MARMLSFSFLTILLASALSAQTGDKPQLSSSEDASAEPVVVEMKIERSLAPEYNGLADVLAEVKADKLVLHYTLTNPAEYDVELTAATISDELNGRVVIVRQPDARVAAYGSTTMTIEVTPLASGPFSFAVGMRVGDRDYSYPVQSTMTSVLHVTFSAHHHHDDDHHCSTGAGGNWTLFGAVAAVLAGLAFRRRSR
jgi:hypothetical protein